MANKKQLRCPVCIGGSLWQKGKPAIDREKLRASIVGQKILERIWSVPLTKHKESSHRRRVERRGRKKQYPLEGAKPPYLEDIPSAALDAVATQARYVYGMAYTDISVEVYGRKRSEGKRTLSQFASDRVTQFSDRCQLNVPNNARLLWKPCKKHWSEFHSRWFGLNTAEKFREQRVQRVRSKRRRPEDFFKKPIPKGKAPQKGRIAERPISTGRGDQFSVGDLRSVAEENLSDGQLVELFKELEALLRKKHLLD